jgi:hypothetical protein
VPSFCHKVHTRSLICLTRDKLATETVAPGCNLRSRADFAVQKSLVAAQALPGFDEKTTLTPEGKPASAMELITLGDAVYMKIGDRPWRKQVITAAARQDMNKKLMATMGPTGCTVAGNETVGGVSTTIYAYRQSIGGKSIDVKVWVGDSDGLPRKMLSKASSASFAYDTIVAPIP